MQQEKKFFSPTLYPTDKDISRTWFIKYYIKDYNKGKLVPLKYKGQLNLTNDIAKRETLAKKYIRDFENNIDPISTKGLRYMLPEDAPENFANTIQLFTQALATIKFRVERITYLGYVSKIRVFHRWLNKARLSNLPIGQLNKQIAKSFMTSLKTDSAYSNTTFNHYKSSLAVLYDEVVEGIDDLNNVNPFRLIKSLPEKNIPFKNIPEEYLFIIRENMPEYSMQLYLSCLLIYYQFIRPTELLRILLSDINFELKQITIRDDVNRKSKKARVIYLHQDIIDLMLQLEYDKMDTNLHLLGTDGAPAPIPVGQNYLKLKFMAFRKQFDIPAEFKLYGLKHTGNRGLAISGVNPHLQMRHNGHSDLNMTQRYINDLDVKSLEHVVESIPRFGYTNKQTSANNCE